MTVRYDNAIHLKGTSSIISSLEDGNPFGPETGQNPGASTNVGA
jgi:hypothetical protein